MINFRHWILTFFMAISVCIGFSKGKARWRLIYYLSSMRHERYISMVAADSLIPQTRMRDVLFCSQLFVLDMLGFLHHVMLDLLVN